MIYDECYYKVKVGTAEMRIPIVNEKYNGFNSADTSRMTIIFLPMYFDVALV